MKLNKVNSSNLTDTTNVTKVTTIDQIFINIFYLFAFIALIFEPIYYYGCNWNYNQCIYYIIIEYEFINIFKYIHNIILDLWYFYNNSYDPLFFNIPTWLQVLCSIEVFLFGPCYFITAYYYNIFVKNPKNNKWYLYFILLFFGSLIYSTIVYFSMEIIENIPNTNMSMVFVVNLPWTIVPILCGSRIIYIYNNSDINTNTNIHKQL